MRYGRRSGRRTLKHNMNKPSSYRALNWFDLRYREPGSWAFIINRITGLALTFYLVLHLIVLNKLTQGPQAYDDFVVFAQLPIIKLGEILLIAAVVLHGLNGLRLTLLAFGVGLRYQKSIFAFLFLITVLLTGIFAMRLFGS